MSFFVSKEIADKVDEDCLVANDVIEDNQKKFILEMCGINSPLRTIEFENVDKRIKIECECNLILVDRLNLGEKEGTIVFKSSSFKIKVTSIEKIFKDDSDNYIVTLNAQSVSPAILKK